MQKYAPIMKALLDKQYPNQEETTFLSINSVNCQFMTPTTQRYFQCYSNLKVMIFTNCDLRNLENFPNFPHLTDLDLANNKLQGTLNYLMKLKNLQYLDISNNLICDVNKLQPLRRINNLKIFIKDNPFTLKDGFKTKIKSFCLQVAKEQKNLLEGKKEQLKAIIKTENNQEKDHLKIEEKDKHQLFNDRHSNLEREIEREMRKQDTLKFKSNEDQLERRNIFQRSRGNRNHLRLQDRLGRIGNPPDLMGIMPMPMGMGRMNRDLDSNIFGKFSEPRAELEYKKSNQSQLEEHHMRKLFDSCIKIRDRERDRGIGKIIRNISQKQESQSVENQINDSYNSSSSEEEKNEQEDHQNMSSDPRDEEQDEQDEQEVDQLLRLEQLEGEAEQIISQSDEEENQQEAPNFGIFMNDNFEYMESDEFGNDDNHLL